MLRDVSKVPSVSSVPVERRIGPETRKLAIRYFARFGDWPPGLRLILRDDPVPEDLVKVAKQAREEWKKFELFQEVREREQANRPVRLVYVHANGEEEVLSDE